jgi:hypothetical protein
MKNTLKLTDEELKSLYELVLQYGQLNESLSQCEIQLEVIETQRATLMEEVKLLNERANELRQEEEKMTQSLIEKYGEFKLNMETMEIELS